MYSPPSYTTQATAVNYFVGSGMCCRWLRYYAKFKVANIAKQHHPEATGFRISDKVCGGGGGYVSVWGGAMYQHIQH